MEVEEESQMAVPKTEEPITLDQVMEQEQRHKEEKEDLLNTKTTYKMLNQPFPQLDWQTTLS